MTGIVAGEGLGLYNGSLAHLNGFGAQGNARLGNGNDRAWVNAANGNLVIQSQDDYLAALGLDVMATRTYNSRGLLDDDNGDNWQLSFYRRLLNLPAGAGTGEITRVNGDGHRAVFTYDSGTGKWISTDGSGAHDTLSKVGSEWVYEEGSSGLRETFDSSGKIIKAQDRDGHGLAFDYNGAGTLITAVRVVDATGATVETTKLTYSGNRLTNIRIDRMDAATDAIRVRYTYDGQGRLSQVRVDLGNPNDITAESGINRYTTTYTYDGTSNRLAGISQSDGSELLITYVQVGNDYRVASLAQREAVVQGSPVYRTATFNYDIADRRTDVTDALGLVTHYHYDTQQRLTRVVSPEASNGVRSTTEYQYDSDDNITRVTTSVTGSTSRAVDYAYDSNGNLTEVRDAGGNTVRRSYNAQNQLSTETVYLTPDPDGAGAGQPGNGLTTRYLYDNEQHLRFIISAEGRVTENRYHANGHAADGQIQSSILHTGQLYSGGSYTEAALESWVNGLSDKQLAERIDYTYDARGQRASQTRYTALDSSGNGIPADSATTRYVYSAAGELLMSIGARNTSGSPTAGDAHVTSYTYDGLGRLRTLQDGSGRISTTSYDAANNTVVTSAPHGLVTTTVYNRAGDRISQQQTAGATDYGTTRYHYDQNSRLRMTEDATGARTHYLYDSRGWQVGMINPEGELTETVYNDAGQIVQVIRYDGRLDPDALVDVDGNPLSFTLDQLRGGTPASPLNPRPVTDLNGVDPGTDHSISDNQASILVAPDATLNDDGSTLTTLTAIILDAPDGIAETLSVNTAGTNLVANWDASRNLLTVTGSGGTARAITQFQQVLRTLSYSNSGGSPTLGARQVQIAVDDGEDHSIVRISTVTLTGPNQGPVVDLNGGAAGTGSSASYAEGAPATTIANPALTVSDADDATLSSAQVVINGRQNGTAEVLSVTTTGTGISASFNASTGVLTLSGTASVADYQQVLRTLKYENSASPMTGSARSIVVTVSDGSSNSAPATIALSLAVNSAPIVDLNGGVSGITDIAFYDEGDPPTLITKPLVLTVSDPDGDDLISARIIINGRQDGVLETLSIDTSGTNISASFNASTGIMTLSGTASTADYQQVLGTLKYQNAASPMAGTSRSVWVTVSDALNTSDHATIVLYLSANNVPVVDLNGAAGGTGYATSYAEGDSAKVIVGSGLTLTDHDDNELTSAQVAIANVQDGAAEALSVTVGGTGISANYNASTGILTLSGTASVADYQQVLRTLKYVNGASPMTGSTRSIAVTVSDSLGSSAPATIALSLLANNAPVIDLNGGAGGTGSSASYAEGDPATTIANPALTVSDADDATLSSAQVVINGRQNGMAEVLSVTTTGTGISASFNASTGVLTLSGTASVADYQQVLRTLKYENSASPMTGSSRTIAFTVSDGIADSGVAVLNLSLVANAAPVVDLNGAAGGIHFAASFDEGDPATLIVSPSLTISDADGSTLSYLQVALNNRQDGSAESLSVDVGATGISANYNASTGVLLLSGTATLADYQQVLRTLKYQNTAVPMTGVSRTVAVSASDGISTSTVANVTLTLVPAANFAPVVDLNGPTAGTGYSTTFTEGDTPVLIVGSTLTVSDPNPGATIAGATITLTNLADGAAENLSVITAGTGLSASYNSSTGVLTLSGVAAPSIYEQVLRTLRYENTSQAPTAGDRSISVAVTDGQDSSASAYSTVTVVPVNDAPVLDMNGAAIGTQHQVEFPPLGLFVFIGQELDLSDVDSLMLTGATVTIADILPIAESFQATTSGTPISGSASGGVFTLSGTATVAEYEAVLRTLRYRRLTPGALMGQDYRDVLVTVTDGQDTSEVGVVRVWKPGQMPQGLMAGGGGEGGSQLMAGEGLQLEGAGSSQTQSLQPQPLSGEGGAPLMLMMGGTPLSGAATNRITSYVYDVVGRQIFTLVDDSEGSLTRRAVTETVYDGAGRITKTIAYANRIAPGALTEAAVRGALSASGDDRISRNFYDGDGLLLATLDGEGGLTEQIYDDGGRLIEQIAYATATNPSQWASGSLNDLRPGSTADDQRSHHLYDARGQKTATIDAEGHLSTWAYDDAGNTVEERRYTGTVSYSGQSVATLQSQAVAATPAGQLRYRASEWVYDSLNRQTEARDILAANGGGLTTLSTTTYAYDTDSGFLISSTHAANDAPEARTTTTDYDHLGRITRQLDGEGSQALAAAAPGAAQEAVWTAYGAHNEHDDAGRVIRSTDASGNTSYYYYDHANRLRYSINAAGEVQETTYNAFGEAADIIIYANRISTAGLTGGLIDGDLPGLSPDANRDRKTTISYTLRGQADIRQDGEGFQIDRDYNAFGQLHTQRSDSGATPGARTRTDTWSYDRRGLTETSTTDSGGLNLSRSREYDAFGRLTGETDARGQLWQTAYDKLGRVVTTTDPLSQTQGAPTTYDAFGRVLTQTDKLGHTTTYQYDDLQRKTTVTSPEGIVTTRTRNAHGEVIEIRLAQAGDDEITRYSYNRDGQLETTVNDMGSAPDLVTTNEYNPAGLLSAVVDARGIRTEYSYDAANRIMTRVIDPGSGTNPLTGEAYLNLSTSYDYNSSGEAIKVTDARGVVTETVFDRKGQTVAVIVDTEGHGGDAPLRLATEYSYDGQGQRITVREGITATPTGTGWNTSGTALRTTAYVYDTAGRRTEEIVDPNGLQITTRYFYDNNNNLTLREDAEGHKWWTVYDGNNRAVFSVSPDGAVRETVYDAEGRATLTTRYAAAANTAGLGQVIDEGNFRSTQVQPSASDRHTAMAYDHDGRMTHQVQGFTLIGGNGTGGYLTAFTHDAAGRTQRMTAYAVSAGASYVLTDAGISGQAAAVADATRDRSEHYYYDAAGRERFHIDATGYLRERLYDASGNLLAEHRYSDALGAGTIAGLGTTADVQAVVANASGAGDQSDTYDYDAASRLSGMTDAENHSETYQLDGTGNRIAFQNKNGHTWTYQYDGAGRMVSETTPEVDYVDGITVTPGSGVYEPDVDLNEVSGTAIETAITYDRLGNVKTRIEAVGTTVERTTTYHYDGAGRQTTVEYPEMDGIMDPLTGVVTDNVQAQTQTWLDGRGNAVVNQDLNGHISRKTYDETGRVQYEIDAEGYVTEYHYNALGDRTQVIRYADAVNMAGYGTSAVTSSQVAGLVASITGNRTVEYQYDLHGQVTKTLLPEVYYYDAATGTSGNRQPETQMQYNAFGEVELQRKLRNTQGGGQWDDTYYYYNQRGERTGQIDPGGYLTEWQHDAYGNVTRQLEWADKLSAWSLVGGSIPQGYAPPTADSVNYGDTSDDVTLIWDQDFSSGTSGLSGNGLSASGNVSVSNGKLHLISSNTSNTPENQPLRVIGSRSYENGDHPTFKFEFSIGGGVLGKQALGVTNWPPTGNTYYAYEHLLLIESSVNGTDNIRFFGKGAGESSNITLVDGVVYELEIDVDDSGTTMYLHQKGGERGSLKIHRENGEANTFVATAVVRNDTSLPSATATVSIDSMEEVTGAKYNAVDAIKTRVARNVRETVYSYDNLNRTLSETRVGVTNDRDENGKLVVGTADGTKTYGYDAVGNLIEARNALSEATFYYYDAVGRLKTELAPVRSYVYSADPLLEDEGRPVTRNLYNALGHTVRQTKYSVATTQTGSERPNEVIMPTSSPNDRVETYLVDLHGRTQSKINERGMVYETRYDRMGRAVYEAFEPDQGDLLVMRRETRYLFDKVGRQFETWTLRDGNYNKEQVQYNAFGEIETSGFNSSWHTVYEYDAAGRMWRTNDGGASKVYVYDLSGNISEEIKSQKVDLGDAGFSNSSDVHLSSGELSRTRHLYNASGMLWKTFTPQVGDVEAPSYMSPIVGHKFGQEVGGTYLVISNTIPDNGVSVSVRLKPEDSQNWISAPILEEIPFSSNLLDSLAIDLDGYSEGVYDYEISYNLAGDVDPYHIVAGKTRVFGPDVVAAQDVFSYSFITGQSGNTALRIDPLAIGATDGMTAIDLYYDGVWAYRLPVTHVGGGQYIVDNFTAAFSISGDLYVSPVGTSVAKVDRVSLPSQGFDTQLFVRNNILAVMQGTLPASALPLGVTVEEYETREIGGNEWYVHQSMGSLPQTVFQKPFEFKIRVGNGAGGYVNLLGYGGTADGWITGTYDLKPFGQVGDIVSSSPELQDVSVSRVLDRWGNVLSESDALGNTTDYSYTTWGSRYAHVAPETEVVDEYGLSSFSRAERYWAYDRLGRNVGEISARGNLSTTTYGEGGVVEKAQAAGEGETIYKYDLFGREVYLQRDGMTPVITTYEDGTSFEKVLKNIGGREYYYYYNMLGRLVQDQSNLYFYNEAGDVVTRFSGSVRTDYEYDIRGWKKSEEDGIGGVKEWLYDDWGRLQQTIGLDGIAVYYSYDHAGQLESEISEKYQIFHSYLNNGWLYSSKINNQPPDMNNAVGGFAAESIYYPDNTVYYHYDRAGRVIHEHQSVSSLDQVNRYDSQGRLLSKYQGDVSVNYQYDLEGNRRSVDLHLFDRDGGGFNHQYWYLYDDASRVRAHGEGQRTTGLPWLEDVIFTQYQYDQTGRRVMSTVRETDYLSVSEQTLGQAFLYQMYDEDYYLTGRESYSYNGYGDLTNVWDMTSGSTLVSQREYYENSDSKLGKLKTYEVFGEFTRRYTYNNDGSVGSYREETDDYTSVSFYTYNNAGVLTHNSVAVNGAGGYSGDYFYTYIGGRNGYLEDTVTATRDGVAGENVSFTRYNPRGLAYNVVVDRGDGPDGKTLTYDVAGRLVLRDHDEVAPGLNTTRYMYHDGKPIGSYSIGSASSPPPVVNFDYNVEPISDAYPAAISGTYIVNEAGESLRNIARQIFGDSNLWYIIADANSIGADEELAPGRVLTIPTGVFSAGNTDDTFRPIGDVIGDTRPDLPVPPPPSEKGCGVFGMVLVIVVAVVVSVVSFNTLSGPAATAVSSVLSTSATGAVATTGGAILAGTAAGAAASAASQLTAIAAGLQDDFSWSDVGRSALQSGLTAGALQGFGLVGTDADALSWLGDFAEVGRAVVSNAVSQGIGMGLDMQDEFNWNALVGTTAASSLVGVTGTALDRLSLSPNGFSETFLQQFAAGTINTGTQMLLEGGGKLDVRSIAADAFGNALGNSIVGAIQQGQEDRKVNDALKRAGIDPDDPSASRTLLNTARGLVQQGYDPKDIATYIGNEDIQARVFGGADLASRTIAGFSDEEVETLRGNVPPSSAAESVGEPVTYTDPLTGEAVTRLPDVVVTGRRLDAVNPFVDDVLHPVMGAAAAFGEFAAQHETLAQLAAAGTQLALMGPAQFVKSTVVDAVVGNTIGPYMDQLNTYIHDKAATWIGEQWGFDADEASFLAHGVAFGGQIVLDSAKNIVGSAKNIRNIVRDERGRFKSDPLNPKSPYTYSDAQRRSDWKQLANDPNSPLTAQQRAEIESRGWRGPQRVNEYGELETMELSHEPVPLREGGADVYPRWPDEHAEIDPYRKLKKRGP